MDSTDYCYKNYNYYNGHFTPIALRIRSVAISQLSFEPFSI